MSILLGLAGAVLFGAGLLLTEAVGELAVDVDFKPFFVTYLFLSVVRFGIPTLIVGLGGALAEGVIDVFEGYELDDPIGFLGYMIGFTAFGWYLAERADDPASPRALTVGALLGAAVQALFEGIAFLIFESSAHLFDASVSVIGNTISHGLLLGAIPLVLLRPRFCQLIGRIRGRT